MADYVDNKLLYAELCVYKEKVREAQSKGEPLPGVSNYIGESIMLIAENFGKKHWFSGYSYLDEMISDAIEASLKYLHNFNEEKYKNPHAYISMITFNAFLNRIKREKKESAKKFKAMERHMILNEGSGMSSEDAAIFQQYYTQIQKEISGQIIENNEEKKSDKPKKSKKINTSNTLMSIIGESDE